MHRLLLLLLILGFGCLIESAAVFEFPDLSRRVPEKSSAPGCAYKGERYAHGERVETPEPCLNCTCIRAVLVCYLRVCPTASAPPPGCFPAREVGECCPSLVCGGEDLTKPRNQSDSVPDLRPTFQPTPAETTTQTEEDSLVYVSSTQDDDITLFNDIPGGCLVNGTLYGDGSAMLSNSFCEYCFCIRGKTTCLQPKCNLSIDGCTPHYDNRFSCCPSRYDCSERIAIKEATKATEKSTSALPTTIPDIPENSAHHSTCSVDGQVYNQGEIVPDYRSCHSCYCSDSSVVCERITCSSPIAGCQPIIPEGHCCPVSYRCDFHSGDSGKTSTKIVRVNGSIQSAENKQEDIKGIKHSEFAKNGSFDASDVKTKNTVIDKDLTSLYHNIIPVHRRLDDDNIPFIFSSTIGTFLSDEDTQGSTTDERNGISTTPHTRENDKTLNLELDLELETGTFDYNRQVHSNVSTQPPTDRITVNDYKENDTIPTVSIGSPEVQTMSIQELFEQFFSRHPVNSDSKPEKFNFEPKRNNSKQPSNIINIFDSETTDQTMSSIEEINTTLNKDLNSDLNSTFHETPTETTNFEEISSTQTLSTEDKNISQTVPFVTDYLEEIKSTGFETEDFNDSSFISELPKVDLAFTTLSTTKNTNLLNVDEHFPTLSTLAAETSAATALEESTIMKLEGSTVMDSEEKFPNRMNNEPPSLLENTNDKNDSSSYSSSPVANDSVTNLYLPLEMRDFNPEEGMSDFMNIGSIYLGAPMSVAGLEKKIDMRHDNINDDKITEGDGVLFMDPKYSDINPIIREEIDHLILEGKGKMENASSNPYTPTEASDSETGHYDKRKEPRIQDALNLSVAGQGYKIIPFVAKDAIRGQFGNNTLIINKETTQGLPDIVSDFCFIKGRIYTNGEMIPKTDPCELCRCFYGQELCQLQRCPTPPDCVAENLPGFCCPRFTCGKNSSSSEQQLNKQKISFNKQSNSEIFTSTKRPEIHVSEKEKQSEVKYGIRVRTRPTHVSGPTRPTLHQAATTTTKPDTKRSTTRSDYTRTATSRTSDYVQQPTSSKVSVQVTTSKTTEHVQATTKKTPEYFGATTSKIPEYIRTKTNWPSEYTRATTGRIPDSVRFNPSKRPDYVRTTTQKPEISSIITSARPVTTSSTTTTQSPLFPDPWGLFKVSGCNIYGKFFNINDQVEILSGPCSHCICTANGVECNDIC
ncbi:Kielin/chordin-like protein, partial [Stegodyphus mimosarum]